jgi:hypothetical protein
MGREETNGVLHPITVEPAEGGWMVSSKALKAPLVFKSSMRAEDAAWRLGRALTGRGAWAEITLKSRDGFRTSRFLCPPADVDALRLSDAYQAA